MPKIQRYPRLPTSIILNSVVERLNKQYKKGRKTEFQLSMLEDSVFSLERPYASSGILPVDWAVCRGKGFPTGIIEIYGPESSGKTALIENAIAQAQKDGWFTIMFAAEYSLDIERATRVGIDKKNLLMLDAETIEDFFDELKDAIKEIRRSDPTTPILVCWDSIASTPTRSEMDNKKGLDASDMGKFAQQMSKFFRRLLRFLYNNKICLLAVNQTRTNLGQMYGNPEITPGGKALKFYAWVRCRLSRVKTLKDSSENEIGFLMEMKVTKNKVSAPFKRCKLHVYWDHGIDVPMSMWEWLIDKNIIKRKGTAYRYHGSVVTKKSFAKLYRDHKEEINQRILKRVA